MTSITLLRFALIPLYVLGYISLPMLLLSCIIIYTSYWLMLTKKEETRQKSAIILASHTKLTAMIVGILMTLQSIFVYGVLHCASILANINYDVRLLIATVILDIALNTLYIIAMIWVVAKEKDESSQ